MTSFSRRRDRALPQPTTPQHLIRGEIWQHSENESKHSAKSRVIYYGTNKAHRQDKRHPEHVRDRQQRRAEWALVVVQAGEMPDRADGQRNECQRKKGALPNEVHYRTQSFTRRSGIALTDSRSSSRSRR
jgi:hypothetical protein